jgi:hypothetical protein
MATRIIGPRTVFDAAWDDEELPRPELDVAVAQLDDETFVEYEEKVSVGLD